MLPWYYGIRICIGMNSTIETSSYRYYLEAQLPYHSMATLASMLSASDNLIKYFISSSSSDGSRPDVHGVVFTNLYVWKFGSRPDVHGVRFTNLSMFGLHGVRFTNLSMFRSSPDSPCVPVPIYIPGHWKVIESQICL